MSGLTPNTEPEIFLHVAVGVVRNRDGEVLIARRKEASHQGGLWEFPGGKVELGETVSQALARELLEELGIEIKSFRPLIQIPHHYPDRSVLLDVWEVDSFDGDAHGKENQPVRWVHCSGLPDFTFPEANRPICTAVALPSVYGIVDVKSRMGNKEVLTQLASVIASGCRLIQLRMKGSKKSEEVLEIAQRAVYFAHAQDTKILINSDQELDVNEADGLHLSSNKLMSLQNRCVDKTKLLGASCHSFAELRQAARIGVDFAVISPVQKTASHPEAEPLGWERFRLLASESPLPVYALGGLALDDFELARENGAQGVAGISMFNA